MFVPFQSSLMFAVKAGAYPNETHLFFVTNGAYR
jgi:hypothetical protein